MSKKIVAMLMAVAMAFSLLPVTAFAAGGTQEGNSQPVTESKNNLTMNKTVTSNGDGTYTVCLESYATGSVTTTQAPVPMDFVLVLDVSGSMDGENGQIVSYGYQETKKKSWSAGDVYYSRTTYYAKSGNEYYPVSCQSKWVPGKWVSGKYIGGYPEYWLEANGQRFGNKGKWGEQLYSESLYTYGEVPGSRMSKLAAMKTAANNFIESVAAQKNGETPVAHRISIVKFADNGEVVKELTNVADSAGLKSAVNILTANGATQADLGMQKAAEVLNGRQDKDRPSVVIMFTDGVPTTYINFNWNVAGAAVDTAKTLKDKNTKVYTIGMFTDADPSDTRGAFNKYMNGVSSKYPGAVGTKYGNDNDYYGITLGDPADGNYYFKADNAGDLEQVFQKISQSTTTTSPLDASAVVVDNVPSNFALTEGSVKVYTADCTGKTGEELNWGIATPATPAQGISSTSTKNDDGSQTISTTGFNFSGNWCGVDGDKHRGQKLIIEFTIERTNYGGTQPTNDGAYIKANADSTDRIIWVGDPEVPVTISLGIPEAELNEKLGVSDQKQYDGSGIPILSALSDKANALVNGTNNAYVNMELTVTVKVGEGETTYTYKIPAKAKMGSWYQGNSTSPMSDGAIGDVKTSKDVKRGTSNEVEEYTYNFDLTLSDATPNGAKSKKYQNNNASFKITPRDVTVKAKDKSVVAGQLAPTYEADVTGTINSDRVNYTIFCDYAPGATGTEFDITPRGEPVQGNYTVTYRPGKLTVTAAPVTTGTLKVTKEVQGENLTLKSLPRDFKITVTGPNSYNKSFPLPENVGDSDKTVTWTISGLPAGEYIVSEENAGVNGYNYTATYSATNDATVIVNNANTAQNQPATDVQASQQVTVTENQTSTMTVTNKYTKQEVVPPTPADPVEWDVSRSKIAKPLDTSTWTSNVTLSLPSAEYEPVIDVVFILDDTYAGNGIFKDAATALLNELSEKKNLDVNVGIVNFDAVARDWVAATTNSQYSGLVSLKNTEGLTALQNAIATKLDKNNDGQTKKIGATNIEWPLEMAQNMLASGKGTEKYAILFSDMYGYVYRGDLIIDGQTYENVPLSKRLYAGESKFYQGSLSMGTKYQSFADVYAHRNDEENQTTDGFFRDSSWDSYWSIYSGHMQIPTNPATKDSPDPFGVPGGYSGFEKSTCLVYDRLLQMKQAGINISIVNNDFAPGDIREVGHVQSIKNDMLDTLEQKGISVIKTQKNVTAEDMTNVFDTLKDQLIQVVSAGSTVTDKIGTNFDFVGLNTMSLKIGDNTIPGVIDEATNTITFKHGGKDNAHVVVYDSSADSFTWTINEDVTKDARVQLTYSVKLTKPETAAGTYGVTDLNGDEKVDDTGADVDKTKALYTNQEAKLVPKDSNGNTGEELTFPKPSVFYTVSSSNSGSHSGGSRPSLNTKDHYGYIIGYPVDYYTGEATTDQTKKPVRPEGKITRAEVATIYFRMLTDESRTKFWSQSNSYSDVKAGDWFNNAVSTLSKAGIIAGYEDGSFKPNGYITRAEFATIAARFFDVTYNGKDLFPDISGHWAKDYINQAANKGFVNGYEDGTFKPDRNITRAEAVTLVNRTLDRHPDKSHFTKDMLMWPDNMDQTKWYYADMQEATNSHTYQMKENSDKTKYENWTKTLPIRNWEALEKAWSNANSSQGNGNVV